MRDNLIVIVLFLVLFRPGWIVISNEEYPLILSDVISEVINLDE